MFRSLSLLLALATACDNSAQTPSKDVIVDGNSVCFTTSTLPESDHGHWIRGFWSQEELKPRTINGIEYGCADLPANSF